MSRPSRKKKGYLQVEPTLFEQNPSSAEATQQTPAEESKDPAQAEEQDLQVTLEVEKTTAKRKNMARRASENLTAWFKLVGEHLRNNWLVYLFTVVLAGALAASPFALNAFSNATTVAYPFIGFSMMFVGAFVLTGLAIYAWDRKYNDGLLFEGFQKRMSYLGKHIRENWRTYTLVAITASFVAFSPLVDPALASFTKMLSANPILATITAMVIVVAAVTVLSGILYQADRFINSKKHEAFDDATELADGFSGKLKAHLKHHWRNYVVAAVIATFVPLFSTIVPLYVTGLMALTAGSMWGVGVSGTISAAYGVAAVALLCATMVGVTAGLLYLIDKYAVNKDKSGPASGGSKTGYAPVPDEEIAGVSSHAILGMRKEKEKTLGDLTWNLEGSDGEDIFATSKPPISSQDLLSQHADAGDASASGLTSYM